MTTVPSPKGLAADAQLRYSTDTEPGIARRPTRRGFRYRGPDGAPIHDATTLDRIAALAVPPAWEGVWICRDAHGHLQAMGRDARHRKQPRYHPAWRAQRDESKFGRLAAFGRALPRVRRRVARDLSRPGLAKDKVLAAVVRLLETTPCGSGTRNTRAPTDPSGSRPSATGMSRSRASTSGSGTGARAAESRRSACTTGGWPGSSPAARRFPARSCSSIWTRPVSRIRSSPPT